MSGYDVVVIGGVNTDYLVKGERLTARGKPFKERFFGSDAGSATVSRVTSAGTGGHLRISRERCADAGLA
jgi:hypothetical protein